MRTQALLAVIAIGVALSTACSGSSGEVGAAPAATGDQPDGAVTGPGETPPASQADGGTTLPSGADASVPDAPVTPFVPSAPVDAGFGITYEHISPGNAVLIVYGGYSAQLPWSQAWGRELVRASLAAKGVGHLYSAQGPKEPGYDSKEIGNTGLRAHMSANAIATGAPFILIAAHSSGSYVAHEVLNQLDNANDTATLGKIVYANLDGGGSGLDDALVSKLRRVAFVYGKDPTLASGLSANSSSAIALGSQYSAYGSTLMMSVPNSGCHSGAKWCLHDLLITHRPHDPDMYDLANDYTDFVNRAVQSDYVDELAQYLK